MAQKLQLCVGHCSATREGKNILPDTILQWHCGPHPLTPLEVQQALKATRKADVKAILQTPGVLRYKGSYYRNRKELPQDLIGGVSVRDLTGRGWTKPGYNTIFLLDGMRVDLIPFDKNETVEPWEISNGVGRAINIQAINWMYIGGTDVNGKPKDTRTPAQHAAINAFVLDLLNTFPKIKLAGHNQFANKACPSFEVPTWARAIGVNEKNIYTK